MRPIDVTSGDEKYPQSETIEKSLKALSRQVYSIAATDTAMQIGSSILGNMVMLGALLGLNLLPLSLDEFRKTLSKNFSEKKLEANLRALEEGNKMARASEIAP